MSGLRIVAPEIVEQFFEMVDDATLAVQPFSVHYKDFAVAADQMSPLDRRNAATYQLRRSDAEAGQWGEDRAIRVLLRRAGTKLEQVFQYARGWRDLVYDIGNAWQTDTELLIGFRLLNGSAGRNRWFGRRDANFETRSPQIMKSLTLRLRQELSRIFASQNPSSDAGLPEQWITVARLPLATPHTLNASSSTKTELVRQLSQALVVGEVLRRESFAATDPSDTPMRHSLNQILYGPPGTGKTFHTVTRAVALLENLSDKEMAVHYPNRAELRKKFEEYRQARRIGFVTFHQAFTYEDFVEGIKPLPPQNEQDTDAENAEEGYNGPAGAVQYAVRKGIFRIMCETAASAVPSHEEVTLTSVPFEELYTSFIAQLNVLIESTNGPVISRTKEGYGVQLTAVSRETGRLTFQYAKGKDIDPATELNNNGSYSHVDKSRIEKLYSLYKSVSEIKNHRRDITEKVGGGSRTLQWVVFNELKKHEASQFAQQREQQQSKPSPPYVLIIDEINRGNVANIFGELITLLEDNKRAGRAEALTITLPYSQEDFSVPENLYILGTMNTADRSVEALDTALRRRFSFTEMSPVPALLPTDVEGINLQEMLRAINSRLEQLLDHDHCIGHALLMGVNTVEQLQVAFSRSILPLLREYFFGDWGKIGLVIGEAFITPVKKHTAPVPYALLPFEPYQKGEIGQKPVFRFTEMAKWKVEAFQKIYGVA